MDTLLTHDNCSKKELRGVSDLSKDWYNDEEDERHGKHHRAIVFGLILQISQYPKEMLGDNFSELSQLYQKSISLMNHLREMEKIICRQSHFDVLEHCQTLCLLWEAAVLEYFGTQQKLDSEPEGLPSYWNDQRELTEEELRFLAEYPLSLMEELTKDPKEEILLLSCGCGGREDQQLPSSIKNYAASHPGASIKVIAVEFLLVRLTPRL